MKKEKKLPGLSLKEKLTGSVYEKLPVFVQLSKGFSPAKEKRTAVTKKIAASGFHQTNMMYLRGIKKPISKIFNPDKQNNT